MSLAQLFVAAAQSQAQLVLQFLKVAKFPLHIGKLFLQTALHRSARLQAIPSQPQKPPDLGQFESEALHAAHEGQGFYVVLAVSSEATFGSWRFWQQAVALVEPNRVNAEPDLFCDDANLHGRNSSPKRYILEYSPESSVLFYGGTRAKAGSFRGQSSRLPCSKNIRFWAG
ncbi:MAG: hypothetical protein WCA91_21765 [Candidatus Acidiferrales bacterium]